MVKKRQHFNLKEPQRNHNWTGFFVNLIMTITVRVYSMSSPKDIIDSHWLTYPRAGSIIDLTGFGFSFGKVRSSVDWALTDVCVYGVSSLPIICSAYITAILPLTQRKITSKTTMYANTQETVAKKKKKKQTKKTTCIFAFYFIINKMDVN